MVISMDNLKELQTKSTIQESVKNMEKSIDTRIELTILDEKETYKAFPVVVGNPNSTTWSGRGPLFFKKSARDKPEVINEILNQLAKKYKEAGYRITGPERIDIGMGQTAPGFYIMIPNQL